MRLTIHGLVLYLVPPLLMLGFFPVAFAQNAYQPRHGNPLTEPWRWRHFPELSDKEFARFAEGPDQTMWLAFDADDLLLMSYDGYRWQEHGFASPRPIGEVLALAVAEDGNVYLGGIKGLLKYDGDTWETLLVDNPDQPEVFPSLRIYHIRSAVGGVMLVATNYGLLYLEQSRRIFFTNAKIARYLAAANPSIQFETDAVFDQNYGRGEARVNELIAQSPGVFWGFLQTSRQACVTIRVQPKAEVPLSFESRAGDCKVPRFGLVTHGLQTEKGETWLASETIYRPVYSFDGQRWQGHDLAEKFSGLNSHHSLVNMA
ncbi:MAG: hypothetical protein AAF804_19540, partial [Bacteroidota bacterium]